MAIINMHDAKTHLSDLVARAEAGEEIVIARRNKPAVKMVPVGASETDDKGRARQAGSLAHLVKGPPSDFDLIFEHAPDDYISKEDIAAYYRKYPDEWDEIRGMVGLAEDKQAEFEISGLREAVEAGREFTIMRDGKVVARVAPATGEKRPRKPGGLKGMFILPESFFDPLPDDEIAAWEGKYSSDPNT